MKISVKKAADKFKLPVDCVLYYATWVLPIQKETTKDSFLNEDEITDIKNELLSAGKRLKEFYFLIEKGIEAKVLDDVFKKRNSQLVLQWDKVLSLRFGYGKKAQTLRTIGDVFYVKQERVRQVESEIIKHLKHPKIRKKLQEQFDFKSYTPKLDIGSEAVALINFYDKHKEESDV